MLLTQLPQKWKQILIGFGGST